MREWIVSVSSYRIEGDLVLPWGGSLSDKALVILSIESRPMTAEELLERTAPSGSMRSFGNQLVSDQRLKRTGVRHWGLREWDHDEYTGIADEIAQEITRQGGTASLEHLVEYISTNYGAAPNSIRSYASGHRFARDARGQITIASTVAPLLRFPATARGA